MCDLFFNDYEVEMIPLKNYPKFSEEEMIKISKEFFEKARLRRTVRSFSTTSVPLEIIENCIKAAGTAPSGANKQPWHFVVVQSPGIKKQIREAAEREERKFYGGKAPHDWLEDLAPLGTDEHKPFLEEAPFLIVIFEQKFEQTNTGERKKHYYTKESVGIATGILITALHFAGLATLTHTPSPMNFLNNILGRPKNERPFLILVTGYPADDIKVPDIAKKNFTEISTVQ